MKFNKNNLFILISVIGLGGFFIYFGSRLIQSYKMEHPKITNKENPILYDTLKSSDQLSTIGNEFYFKGENPNNYVLYSGRLFRVVSFNMDQTIKLVSAEAITFMNFESGLLTDSSLWNWLNQTEREHSGIFSQTLEQPTDYLTNTKTCMDQFDKSAPATCLNENHDYLVGLLSIQEYMRAGANQSYFNQHDYWWTSNTNKENQPWYVFLEGGINTSTNASNHYSVYPTITLKPGTLHLYGVGTKENPYVFIRPEKKSLSEIAVGQYLSYSNTLWRVVSKNEGSVKVVSDTSIMVNEKEEEQSFSNKENHFQTKEGIGFYLNHKFYETLQNKDYLVEGTWNVGRYGESSYDYLSVFAETEKAYVGLLGIGELFLNRLVGTSLITDHNDEEVYIVSEDGKLYSNLKTANQKIRPSIYLDSKLNITEGSGLKENPYEIVR